jgi:serine/threonine protein kinase
LETHIKSLNIVGDQGNFCCKIVDLGVARYLSDSSFARTTCGTPLTSAPEVHLNKKYDHKAEVWSIGCIFYQFLTGFYPFVGSSAYNLIKNMEKGYYFIPKTVKLSYEGLNFLN